MDIGRRIQSASPSRAHDALLEQADLRARARSPTVGAKADPHPSFFGERTLVAHGALSWRPRSPVPSGGFRPRPVRRLTYAASPPWPGRDGGQPGHVVVDVHDVAGCARCPQNAGSPTLAAVVDRVTGGGPSVAAVHRLRCPEGAVIELGAGGRLARPGTPPTHAHDPYATTTLVFGAAVGDLSFSESRSRRS